MARGPAAAGGWHPLPLPTAGCGPVGPGVDLEKVNTAPGWVQPCDRQQEAPREGVEGTAGPSIWSRSLLWAARALLPG